jgi:hypothetical protein
MTARATTPTAGHLDLGSTWLIGLLVLDDVTDQPVDATVAITVTRPDGSTSTPTVTQDGTGYYYAKYVTAAAGRHTATASVSGDVVDVVLYAVQVDAVGTIPDLAAVKAYLGTETTRSDAEISSALAAEIAAQARVCNIGAVYPADLAEALKRRVQRNLYMRGLPSGLQTVATESGALGIKLGADSEINRLEAPFRKLVCG